MANEHNPGNALGTPNKYGGRTSIEGFSAGVANAFSSGIVSGFKVRANTPAGMSVLIGGNKNGNEIIKDVALLKNASTGDRFTVFNKANSPVEIDIPVAPSVNSRIDAVVVYRDMVVNGDNDDTDNPSSVGIVVVSGTSAVTPANPTDSQIRSALPNGTSALYEVLAYVKVAAGVAAINDSNITDARAHACLNNDALLPAISDWTKTKSTSFAGGYGKTIYVVRTGSIVTAYTRGGNSLSPTGQWTSLNEKCPAGYRPATSAMLTGCLPGVANPCVQTIDHNGSMSQIVMSQGSSNDYCMTATWITDDDWPS